MTDDNNDTLDTLIDDVAQAMTTSAPGGPAGDAFARRVSTRIAEAGDHRQSWFRPWVLVPIAAACVLVLAVVVVRRDNVRLKPDATPDAPNEMVRLKPDTTDAAPTDAAAMPPRAVSAPAPVVRIQPVALAPIEIDPIAIEPLVETNAVQITPIAIERIDISPMP